MLIRIKTLGVIKYTKIDNTNTAAVSQDFGGNQ